LLLLRKRESEKPEEDVFVRAKLLVVGDGERSGSWVLDEVADKGVVGDEVPLEFAESDELERRATALRMRSFNAIVYVWTACLVYEVVAILYYQGGNAGS